MANVNRSQPPLHNTFGRVPTTNRGGGKDKEGNMNAPSSRGAPAGEDGDALIDRHARGFARDVQKRNKGVRGKRRRTRD